MKHEEAWKLLNDYNDGNLPEETMMEIEDHLEVCTTCRNEATGLHALVEKARNLPHSIDPPRDLWSDIATAIGEESPGKLNVSRQLLAKVFLRGSPGSALSAGWEKPWDLGRALVFQPLRPRDCWPWLYSYSR